MTDYRTAKGWLTINERELLARLPQEVGSTACVLNLGTEYGASVHCLLHGARQAKDNWWVDAVDVDMSKQVGLSGVVGVTLHEGTSEAFYNALTTTLPLDQIDPEGGVWDVVFVDADHSYQAVTLDTRFAEYIPIGGIIAFHDCYSLDYGKPHLHPHSPDCNIAVSDWYAEQAGKWEEQESVDSIRWFRRVT